MGTGWQRGRRTNKGGCYGINACKLEDLLLVSRLYGFFLLRVDPHTHVLLLKIFPFINSRICQSC
jgi:hypothetical protein